MVGNNTKESRSPLLPLRHETRDFFVCDVFDAAFKGDTASMEHPIFSLATKPDHREREYRRGDRFLKVRPSPDGLATVFDRDVLIYCISQLMTIVNAGEPVPKTLQFKAYDLLVATNRGTDGRGYEQLKAAFSRLQGTQIQTNITTGGKTQFDVFSLIDRATIVSYDKDGNRTHEGRMGDVQIQLSDWVINAIESNEVLTLNRQYFQLRKPLERRLYELARKHCGMQTRWQIGLEALREKTGSNSTPKEFKRLISAIIGDDTAHDHMPDYRFTLEADIVTATPRSDFAEAYRPSSRNIAVDQIHLKPDTMEKAVRYAGGWDRQMLLSSWKEMIAQKGELPKNADGAFISYCKWYVQTNGSAR